MAMPSWSLTGHTALVTGGAGGIGQAVATDLIALGARVVIADVGTDRLAAVGTDIGATSAYVDLADDGSLEDLAATARAEGCTILVNCAGIAPDMKPLAKSDPANWDRLYRINQRAPMRLTQLLLPGMIRHGWGRVIHVSSDSARAGSSGESIYSATKAALLGFTKSVAREVARHGVTSNVVCPGPIRTRMVEDAMGNDPGLEARLERLIPMGRLGQPEDVSAAVAWLASPRAGFITGQVLSISGGVTMH